MGERTEIKLHMTLIKSRKCIFLFTVHKKRSEMSSAAVFVGNTDLCHIAYNQFEPCLDTQSMGSSLIWVHMFVATLTSKG